MYSSAFVIAAMFVLSALGNLNYGELPQTGAYGGGAPQTGAYGGGAPQTGAYGGGAPQTGAYGGGAPQTGAYGGSAAPQYGSQGGNAVNYDPTGLPPMDYGKEDPIIPDIQCEQDQTARIDNPTCSLQQSCQLGGFCANQRFGLYNPKRKSCMAVECYISSLTKFTNLFRKNKKDPKLRLVTRKCSLGMSFRQTGEHTFGWQTCASQVGHLNLVHYPKEGGQLCARRRKWATFFYPCDSHSTKYTLGAVSQKRGTFQIQAQSVSGLRAPGCLTAPGSFGAKVSTQKCGGLFCYKEQQWQKVQCQ